MAMTLGHRIAVLVVTALMALMMVARLGASAADADHQAKSQGKNSGWGDGKGHPKKNKGGGDHPTPF
jgi:pectate lyase